jgi:hypothetical protein
MNDERITNKCWAQISPNCGFPHLFFSSRDHTAGADSMCVARRTAATARALTLRTLTILTVDI